MDKKQKCIGVKRCTIPGRQCRAGSMLTFYFDVACKQQSGDVTIISLRNAIAAVVTKQP
jgi:hypothetical protein